MRGIFLAFACLVVIIAGCTGGMVASIGLSHPEKVTTQAPIPHQIPKYAGGASFRFAMVHDVLHERFPRHGKAHYEERNRLTREKLAKLDPDDPASFPLVDDLAAGLTRLGDLDQSITLLQAKLKRQEALGMTGRDLYSSYANLGAIQFHRHLGDAIAGNREAREQARAGLELVRKSVQVNPEAHFGRERWQVAYGEFMLAAIDDPNVLTKYDFIGDQLERGVRVTSERSVTRNYMYNSSLDNLENLPDGMDPSDPAQWSKLVGRRDSLTQVGEETDFDKVYPHVSLHSAYDEPMLGIVGMWRQGIGADPHFALCIGEVMLRVGQRHIAWSAFERASRLGDKFWPDPAKQQFLRDHCKKRQGILEQSLAHSSDPEQVAQLRQRFDDELAFGEAYQREYQKYEETKLAAGVPLGDEHFYDEFNAGREPIASPSGAEEWITVVRWYRPEDIEWYITGWCVLGAGVAAMMFALFLRWRRHRPIETSAGTGPSPWQTSQGDWGRVSPPTKSEG